MPFPLGCQVPPSLPELVSAGGIRAIHLHSNSTPQFMTICPRNSNILESQEATFWPFYSFHSSCPNSYFIL